MSFTSATPKVRFLLESNELCVMNYLCEERRKTLNRNQVLCFNKDSKSPQWDRNGFLEELDAHIQKIKK